MSATSDQPKGDSAAKPDPFRTEVDRLKAELNKLTRARASEGDNPGEWLRALYTAYAERMRSDNERIWSTGAIFVPLALSAFAALLAVETPALWKTTVLAGGSCALLVLWLFIAEDHRSFQQQSEAWMVAILEVAGLEKVGGEKLKGNALNRALTCKGAIQKTRWFLVGAVLVAWIVVFVLQAVGCILVDPAG